jgi:hypothetical protein
MQLESRMFAGWLAPLPEEEYLRIIYFGKLQIPSKLSDSKEKDIITNSLENMMTDIWKVASSCNKSHMISGHLSWTKECHVCQLIEGKADEITRLIEKIRKDPRVVIYKEFQKKLKTMNRGWDISMCYSFQITSEQYRLVADENITPTQMFQDIRNSYEVRREGWKLNEFYKSVVDTFLLKYISIHNKVKFNARKT